jgi:hypothetical protein
MENKVQICAKMQAINFSTYESLHEEWKYQGEW